MEKFENEKAAGGDQTISAASEIQHAHSTTHTTLSCNSASAQRARLLEHLRISPIDTLRARTALDIMHPAARVMELRKQGMRIDTELVLRPTAEGKLHSVALYVLQPGELSDEQPGHDPPRHDRGAAGARR